MEKMEMIEENSLPAEEALRKERDFTSAVLSTAGALVVVLDRNGRIVRFNKACERATGYSFDEVKGRHFWNLLLIPEEVDDVKAVFAELKAGQFPNTHENFWVAKDGSRRMIRWSNTSIADKAGSVEHVIGTGIDITDLKETQKELTDHKEHLEELVQQRTAALVVSNRRLEQEVEVRKKADNDLRQALSEVAQLKGQLEAENIYLKEAIKSSHDFEEIVGETEVLKEVLHRVEQVASTDATVLILGETGTGKELIAHAIHDRSSRRNRPFVRVSCSALPPTLIETELFGHERGAFTGALARTIGRFELANGSTIFLDEIGDLPLDLQAKLLRVLQEGEFERIGSTRTMKVDVRVLAATNRNLEEAVEENRFRSDLYYRLNVFPIQLPPLRDRIEDIPMLISHIIAKKQDKLGKTIERVPQDVVDALRAYDWPGNVRELENVIEHSAILSPGATLKLCDLFGPGHGSIHAESGPQCLDEVERAHILKVVVDCDWKIRGKNNAADRLGINPSTLRSRMKKLGLARPNG
jgi:PAS domain S-box-containing protein